MLPKYVRATKISKHDPDGRATKISKVVPNWGGGGQPNQNK